MSCLHLPVAADSPLLKVGYRRSIPFVKFGGLRFLDAAHVKDMVALLRFVQNPRDRVGGFRILHLLPGIGPASDRMAGSADQAALLICEPERASKKRLCQLASNQLASDVRPNLNWNRGTKGRIPLGRQPEPLRRHPVRITVISSSGS
jgi:hypothetical protein